MAGAYNHSSPQTQLSCHIDRSGIILAAPWIRFPYPLQWGCPTFNIGPGYLDALKHLTDLKEEGKIKTLGLTNFNTENLRIILENGIPVVSNQVQHSIVDMRPQQEMVELCREYGVQLITYGAVMGGLLSEKCLGAVSADPTLDTPSLQKYKKGRIK